MAASTLEEVLRHFGDPGRSQMILWLLVLFTLFHVGMIQQFNIMISFRPEHRCKIPASNWSHPSNTSSFPIQAPLQLGPAATNESLAIPEETNSSLLAGHGALLLRPKGKEERCYVYDPANPQAGKQACPNGWEYDTPYDELYPVNEFDLVCDDAYLLSLALSLTFVGVMVGGVVFGPVSDFFGRRVTIATITTVLSVLSIAIFFVPNFGTFVLIRVLLGVLNQGLQTVCLTYVTELFLPRIRTLTSAAIGMMWALMLPLLAVLFYGLGNWRHVHLFMGVGSLISAAYVWFLPESVVWLLTRGRVTEAAAILKKFARFNKMPPPPTLLEDLESIAKALRKKAADNANKSNMAEFWRSKALLRITLSLLYVWFATACVVFGLSFSIAKLFGNMYVNYSITGFMEVALRVIVLWFFMRYGRIKIITPLLIICGILTIVSCLVKEYVESSEVFNVAYLTTALALLARNFIAVNFTLTIIFTAETFPTVLRSTGIGLGFTAARLGNVVTPFIYFRIAEFWDPAPQVIYGIMALIAGFVVLTLPETFNRPMPNTVKEVEDMMKKKKQQRINSIYVPSDVNPEYPAANDGLLDANTDERREPNIIYKSVKELAGSLNK